MSSITTRKVVMSLLMLAVLVFASTSDAQAQIVDVDIAGFAFSPQTLNITTGTTVRWTNQDAAPHTSTSDAVGWDSGTLTIGQQFSFTFASQEMAKKSWQCVGSTYKTMLNKHRQ